MQEIDYNHLKQELWSNAQALQNGADSFETLTNKINEQIAHLEMQKAESEKRRLEICARLEELAAVK